MVHDVVDNKELIVFTAEKGNSWEVTKFDLNLWGIDKIDKVGIVHIKRIKVWCTCIDNFHQRLGRWKYFDK